MILNGQPLTTPYLLLRRDGQRHHVQIELGELVTEQSSDEPKLAIQSS
jgi:hypothetical protein